MSTSAVRFFHLLAIAWIACILVANEASSAEGSAGRAFGDEQVTSASEAAFEAFLDRLMLAESNGRDLAANPRSTALGPFQFIKATFIEVARRHFTAEVATLSDEELLVLRTNRDFARRAAAAYSKDNLAHLSEQGLKPTFGHLRLAFLVGPTAAVRLLRAPPVTAAAEILSAPVMVANPFLSGMTAAELIARAAQDIGEVGDRTARPGPRSTLVPRDQGPAIAVYCSPKLASCRRWVALRTVNQQRRTIETRRGPSPSRKVQRPGV